MSAAPRRLGRSGLVVSPLCLGTMMFGVHTDRAEARRIADLALDRGAFFWDTADMYGKGASEQVVGELLAGRRDRVVLATKGWADMGRHPNDRGLSARHLIEAVDASLARLKTDYIDLYYLHLPDRDVPLDETLRAAEDVLRAGKVRYLAASNFYAWEYAELVHTARERGWQPISAIQPLYNLVNRGIEADVLPMAHRYGLGVVTYSPLARGVLTGKYSGGERPAGSRLDRADPRFLTAEWRDDSVAVAEALRPLAAERGCSPGQLATAWAMANQRVHSVIIGPRTYEQAEEALRSLDVVMDDLVEAAVDRLVPPGSHTGVGAADPQYFPVTGRVR